MSTSRKALVLLGLLIGLASPALARKWTDATGKFSVEAELVGLADNTVTLKREDGQVIRLPVNGLSAADQQLARKLARSGTESEAGQNPFVVGGDTPAKALTADTTADDENNRTVLTEGVGTTADEALKDAFRNAVRQVVGEVVDAETLIKNDDIVKDQVLTYSDAFIPTHRKVSEKSAGGLFRITIQATVQRRSLVMKLKATNITVKDIDGQSLFGNVVSQLDAEQNAEALIRRAMEGFPESCIEARVIGDPKLLDKDTASAKIQVEVRLQADKEAYKAFAIRLTRALDAVARDRGDFTSTTTVQTNPGARHWPKNARIQPPPQLGPPFGRGQFVLKNEVVKWLPRLFTGQPNAGVPQAWKPGTLTVAISTNVTNAGKQLQWRYYDLPRELGELFTKAALRGGECTVKLLDASGEVVATDRFTPKCGDSTPWNASLLTLIGQGAGGSSYTAEVMNPPDEASPRAEQMHLVLIAPLFLWQTGSRHAPSLSVLRDVALSLEEIRRIRRAKCELSFH